MLDQVAALHWVKENIAAFDGDPNDVTLIGHRHGAALVNLLMVSPVTKGNKAQQLYADIMLLLRPAMTIDEVCLSLYRAEVSTGYTLPSRSNILF